MTKTRGFTLAEVLITLSIIGVVAAMTIPTLVSKFEKAALYNQFMNSYSIISAATTELSMEYSGDFAGAFNTPDDIMNAFATKMAVIKKCTVAEDSQACSYDYTKMKALGGGSISPLFMNNNNAAMSLKNGSWMEFMDGWKAPNCDDVTFVKNGVDLGCYTINVDVNGQKGPNTFGRDIFQLYVYRYGLVADGVEGTDDAPYLKSDHCDPSIVEIYNGNTCGARLLLEGKMNY